MSLSRGIRWRVPNRRILHVRSQLHSSRIEERKFFPRRALLRTEGASEEGRTIDISQRDLSLILDTPLPAGASARLIFNITIDRRTTQLEFEGRVVWCIRQGPAGYRVRFEVEDDEAHGRLLAGVMARLT